VAAVGRIMIPAMEARGASREYATALTCSASLLGPIIPPSITMVIYAVAPGPRWAACSWRAWCRACSWPAR